MIKNNIGTQSIYLIKTDQSGGQLDDPDIDFLPISSILWDIEDRQKYPQLLAIDPYGITFLDIPEILAFCHELGKLRNTKLVSKLLGELIEEVVLYVKGIKPGERIKFIGD